MTYLLDTNVWSELCNRGRADDNVRMWAEEADPALSHLSAVTVFEFERGVLLIERRDPEQGSRLRRSLDVKCWRLRPMGAALLNPWVERAANAMSPSRTRFDVDALQLGSQAVMQGGASMPNVGTC